MKHLYVLLISTVLILTVATRAAAQVSVTFINPTFPANKTDYTITTPTGNATVSAGTIATNSGQASFSITVYRSSTSADNGYVSIYSGTTGPTNLLTSDIVSQNAGASNNTKGRQWSTSGNVSFQYLSGAFDTGNIPTGDQKIYAVYFNFYQTPLLEEQLATLLLSYQEVHYLQFLQDQQILYLIFNVFLTVLHRRDLVYMGISSLLRI